VETFIQSINTVAGHALFLVGDTLLISRGEKCDIVINNKKQRHQGDRGERGRQREVTSTVDAAGPTLCVLLAATSAARSP